MGMPFISRGVTVGFVRADEKSSVELLKELMEKRFTGRVEFDIVCGDERLSGSIEMLNGDIVGVEVEVPRRLYSSDALILVTSKWLKNCRGFAEIIQLDEEKVKIDLEYNSRARIEAGEARKIVESAESLYREITAPKVAAERAPERAEEAPTAPLPTVPLPSREETAGAKPSEEVEVVATERAAPAAGVVAGVEMVASSENILERLDSAVFDAVIVLKGTLAESGAIEPREVPKLIEKLVEISKEHSDKTIVAFVNDRLNEIRGKLVAHDGMLVAVLVKKDSERMVDEEGLKALASFERGLLYSIYLVDPSVDETLHRLAQEAVRKAREEAAREERAEEQRAEQPAETGAEAHRETGEAREREEGRRRHRFLFFLRRR